MATSSGSLFGGLFSMVVMLGVLFGIFYFLVIRPQNKRVKDHQKMLDRINVGDRIITMGGIYATVDTVKSHYLMVEISPNVKVKIMRNQILGMAKDEGKKMEENKKNDKV